jgi:hypothetical protein
MHHHAGTSVSELTLLGPLTARNDEWHLQAPRAAGKSPIMKPRIHTPESHAVQGHAGGRRAGLHTSQGHTCVLRHQIS